MSYAGAGCDNSRTLQISKSIDSYDISPTVTFRDLMLAGDGRLAHKPPAPSVYAYHESFAKTGAATGDFRVVQACAVG